MQSFQVISFDLDHTIFDFDRTLTEALLAVSTYLSRELGFPMLPQHLRETRDRLAEEPEGQAMAMLELRRWSFETVLKDAEGGAKLVDRAMEIFRDVRFSQIYYYPDAEHVLRLIASRYTLAAVTNGNSDPEKTSPAGVFDHVVFAEDHPFRKPDPRIFALMMGLAHVEDPARVCHIGDGLENDVGGGNDMGFSTVWFNPDRLRNETSITPSYEIHSLQELLPILGLET